MQHFPMAIASMLVSASPLMALCPASRDDARSGIEVVIDDGARMIVTRGDDGIVTEDWTYEDGFRLRIRAMHGVHPVEIAELDDAGLVVPGTEETTIYAEPFPPEPVLGAEWSSSARILYGQEDGGEIFHASIARAEGVLSIGACSYGTVTVTQRITDGGEVRMEEVDFLPDLGVAILRATGSGLADGLLLLSPVEISQAAP